jgi:hypothetical protein
MKRFADLYALLDETTKTSVKVETAPFFPVRYPETIRP